MAYYIGKRIVTGLLSLFVLVTVTFFLIRLMPGNPFQSNEVSGAVLESMEEEYGLHEPLAVQYGTYLHNLLRGDLGLSYKKPGVTVEEVIARAWPVTLSVGLPACMGAVLLGAGLGIWQARSKSPAVKGAILTGISAAAGIPNFVLALVLMLLFGVKWKLLPIAGLLTPWHYILPVVSLALYPAAVIARLMHNSFSKEMQQDYVMMAQAKGLGSTKVAVFHILRNAWIPVLSYVGPMITFLLTGSFVVESIFTIPGLGREFVNSIANRDYTLIMGLTIFMGTVVITVNLFVDLLCAWVDPRIPAAFLNKQ